MQNTSGITNYSTLIAGSYTVETKVSINGVDYGEDVLISVETTGSLFKDDLPVIGSAVSGEIDIRMLMPSATIPRMATIKPYIRLSNIAGTVKSGWLQKGEYFIDTRSVTHNDDGIDILKIHGYDAMLKAEATYPDDNQTYPKSDTYVLNLIATTMGIQIDSRTTALMTEAYQIVHPAFASMRQVLKNIAGMYAGNFIISPEGKLLLVQLGSIGDGTGTPNHAIGKSAQQMTVAPAFAGFSKVIIRTGEYDSSGNEIVYESGNTTGRTLECEIDWGSQTVADNILSIISGWSYQPYDATNVVINPALELGDSISINGVYSGIYTNTLNFSRLFTADTKAPYDEEIDHEYAYEDPREKKYIRRMEEVRAEMSILAGTITAKVDKTKTGQTFGWTVTDSQWNVFNEDGPILTVNSGGTYVKGEIQADSGLIGGFNIGSDAIYHTISSYGSQTSNTGVYLGTDGIQLGKKFLVDPYGNVSASALTVTGGSLSIGDDGQGNPMFQVTSAGYVTAKSLAIQGGSISIGGNFYVDSNGNLSANSGTFAGNVYAGNIKYEATTTGAGTVSGAALTLGSVTGGLSGDSPIGQLSLGACLSLGYADLFNAATGNGTSTYPNYFTAGRLIATTSVRCPIYYVPSELPGDPDTNLSNHYHSINVSGGTVTIGGPYNSSTPPSFNIADTQYYQDGVAAVTISSRSILTTDSSTVNTYDTNFNCQFTADKLYNPSGTNYQYGRLELKNAAGNVLKTLRIQLPNSSASVDVSSASGLTTTSSDYTTYDKAVSFAASSLYDAGSTLYARLQVTLSNGNTAIIRAGIPDPTGSVTVSSASGLSTTSSNYTTYDQAVSFASSSLYDAGSTLYARLQVTLSNGNTAIIRAGIPDPTGSVTVSSASGLTTTSSNYTTYDQTVSFAASSLYDAGSTLYARIQATLSNGTTAIIRAAVPDTSSSVTLSAASGLSTTSSNYTTYDKAVSFAASSLYTSGSTQYARIQATLSNGATAIIRAGIPASSSVTVASITSASTEYDYSDYYYSGGRWKLYVHAKDANGNVLKTDTIDVQHAVNYGAQQGGGGGPTNSVRLYCYSRTETAAGRVECDFSVTSYSGLFWQQGYYYDFYYY